MNTVLLSQLQTFVAVARYRSFTRAAKEMGVSPSAVSQTVRQLEENLHAVLLTRTTRSVSLTEAGARLVESAGPGLGQVLTALTEASAQPGEAVGHLKLSVPRSAVQLLVTPVLPAFRGRYPRIDVEVVIEDRLVDLVREGYDAGVRLSESIQRDMVQVRLAEPFRFVVVGSPAYLRHRGVPQRPEDLLQHECLTVRSQTTGALYVWELERGRRPWRVAVHGGVVINDSWVRVALVEAGLGLTYVDEPAVAARVRTGLLKVVLDAYSPTVPGFFMYFPRGSRTSPPLRAFVETARELLASRK